MSHLNERALPTLAAGRRGVMPLATALHAPRLLQRRFTHVSRQRRFRLLGGAQQEATQGRRRRKDDEMIIELEEADDDRPAKTIDTEAADREALAAALVEVHGWTVNLEKIIDADTKAMTACGLMVDGAANLPLVIIKPKEAQATFAAAMAAFYAEQAERED
jgi:hypothetical protein